MTTASQRIIGAIERHGITWEGLTVRVSNAESLSHDDAGVLVSRLREGGHCPLVVAAAVISIIAELGR